MLINAYISAIHIKVGIIKGCRLYHRRFFFGYLDSDFIDGIDRHYCLKGAF